MELPAEVSFKTKTLEACMGYIFECVEKFVGDPYSLELECRYDSALEFISNLFEIPMAIVIHSVRTVHQNYSDNERNEMLLRVLLDEMITFKK